MSPDPNPDQDVAEKKDEEVLEREGVEQELMQHDRSEVGEDLEGVEETGE